MTRFRAFFYAALVAATFQTACNNSDSSGNLSVEQLQKRADSLNVEMDKSWAEMMRSDDKKITHIQWLMSKMDSLGYCHTDSLPSACDTLQKLYTRLTKERYTPATMSNSLLIDNYDLRTDSLLDGISHVLEQKPDSLTNPTIKDLYQKIRQADDSVIYFHSHYDKQVDSYNAFLDFHGETLEKAGYPADRVREKPLFRPVK
ncbi:hypothetical protein SAMN05421780_106233 [Flexibacter flexilis DSM 6793]|uniref:Lipoprotein n=1 Tax=Flexibacter flexilis DSM 6793 TaxID=927664 RepID=A0A1I1K354_9BACT|nr:hypothetical protein [Flexibacter flexilis]SFC55379.1 hypothetical protein SAMN05421780_106233 [Flexibacter flexilis DSM 6793]